MLLEYMMPLIGKSVHRVLTVIPESLSTRICLQKKSARNPGVSYPIAGSR